MQAGAHADGTCGGPMYCPTCQGQRAATPPRPDLSHLLATEEGQALYIRYALVMVRGAVWRPSDVAICRAAGEWWLSGGGVNGTAFVRPGTSGNLRTVLPDPENDPAAAWDLMVRERTGLAPYQGNSKWSSCGGPVSVTRESACGALVRAVLYKHAAGPHADLIRPLLAVDHA